MCSKCILLVDRDLEFGGWLAERLRSLGPHVICSTDPARAFHEVHRTKPDLIILNTKVGRSDLIFSDALPVPVVLVGEKTNDSNPSTRKMNGLPFVRQGPGFWSDLSSIVCELLTISPSASGETRSIPCADTRTHHLPATFDATRPRLLCIDDDPDITTILKMRLEPFGIEVLRAFDGTQGFWIALNARPDAIITDLKMPNGAGNYVLGRLKSHPLTRDVPVIVLTGRDNVCWKRELISLGAAAFLVKPVDLEEVRDVLGEFLPLECPVDVHRTDHSQREIAASN